MPPITSAGLTADRTTVSLRKLELLIRTPPAVEGFVMHTTSSSHPLPTSSSGTASELPFDPPGPGFWRNDRSHCVGSITPLVQDLMATSMEAGMRKVFAEIGVPADTLECRFVHGFMYTRLRPLIGGSKPMKKLPPLVLLKLGSRVHPEMRRRAKSATAALRDRPWQRKVAEWDRDLRPDLKRQNAVLQAVDPASLDDPAALAHFEDVLAHNRRTWELHFYLHGFDLGPIGLLLFECDQVGVPAQLVFPALEGASPSTTAPSRILGRLRALSRSADPSPATLDELRA